MLENSLGYVWRSFGSRSLLKLAQIESGIMIARPLESRPGTNMNGSNRHEAGKILICFRPSRTAR